MRERITSVTFSVCMCVSICHGSDFEDGVVFLNRHRHKLGDDLSLLKVSLFEYYFGVKSESNFSP